jgi:hypothetical protein
MEITQHARYTCTFCGKVRPSAVRARAPCLTARARPGQREALRRRHLELQGVQEDDRGRRLDRVHDRGGHRAQVRSPVSRLCWPGPDAGRSTIRRLREINEA